MVVNRLKEVLASVVSDLHSGFMKGHLIIDNVLIASEVNHYLKRKRQGRVGMTSLKVDMRKAYDRLEWGFLRDMMRKLTFCQCFIDLVLLCVISICL